MNKISTVPLSSLLPHPLCCSFLSPQPSITVLQSMKLGIDVNRHKEIIVKSISALLLLLLKHFKLNHIYQVSAEKGSPIAKLVLKPVCPDRPSPGRVSMRSCRSLFRGGEP